MRKLIIETTIDSANVEIYLDSKFAPMKRLGTLQARNLTELAEKVGKLYDFPGYWRKSPLLELAQKANGATRLVPLGLVAFHEDAPAWWSVGYWMNAADAIEALIRAYLPEGSVVYVEQPVDSLPGAAAANTTDKQKGKGKAKKAQSPAQTAEPPAQAEAAPAEPEAAPEPPTAQAEVEAAPAQTEQKPKRRTPRRGVKAVGEPVEPTASAEAKTAPTEVEVA